MEDMIVLTPKTTGESISPEEAVFAEAKSDLAEAPAKPAPKEESASVETPVDKEGPAPAEEVAAAEEPKAESEKSKSTSVPASPSLRGASKTSVDKEEVDESDLPF